MQHDHVLKKLNLHLLTLRSGWVVGGGGVVGKIIATNLLYFVIPFCLIMQHDHVLKKLYFDLLTSSPEWGV